MTSRTKCHDTPRPTIAVEGTLLALPRRALAALDRWIGWLLFWQQIDYDIRRLACLSDAELQRLRLERNEIVARVYEAVRARSRLS